jgi:hypothetical protein
VEIGKLLSKRGAKRLDLPEVTYFTGKYTKIIWGMTKQIYICNVFLLSVIFRCHNRISSRQGIKNYISYEQSTPLLLQVLIPRPIQYCVPSRDEYSIWYVLNHIPSHLHTNCIIYLHKYSFDLSGSHMSCASLLYCKSQDISSIAQHTESICRLW